MPSKLDHVTANEKWTTGAGRAVVIRGIRGDDEEALRAFHRSLSPESVYTRYFNTVKLNARIAHARLERVCHPSPESETVLVVETKEEEKRGNTEIIAVGRLSISSDCRIGEVAVVVSDAFQRQGVGRELMRRLIADARERRLDRLVAYILPTNVSMQRLCENAGMHLCGSGVNGAELTAIRELSTP